MIGSLISNKWGVSLCKVSKWLEINEPDKVLLERFVNEFTKEEGCFLISNNMRLEDYIFEHKELLCDIERIPRKLIRKLTKEVYLKHLSNLVYVDSLTNYYNGFSFPFCSYNAEAFVILRNIKLKKDIKFLYEMFDRKKVHYTFISARRKFQLMALYYEKQLMESQNDVKNIVNTRINKILNELFQTLNNEFIITGVTREQISPLNALELHLEGKDVFVLNNGCEELVCSFECICNENTYMK
jgi:hypothetical protein